MRKYSITGAFLLPVLLLFILASCKKEIKAKTGEENLLTSTINAKAAQTDQSASSQAALSKAAESELLKAVRRATSRFHSTTQAIMAGYEPDDHCVSVPGLGGMGFHWANMSLVDPVFDPLKPEVLLYATGPGGNLRLVAIEYIVINVGQPRPMFDDHPFDIGGTPVPVPHWSLHVWLYEPNPNGIFTPFNPNITCQ